MKKEDKFNKKNLNIKNYLSYKTGLKINRKAKLITIKLGFLIKILKKIRQVVLMWTL